MLVLTTLASLSLAMSDTRQAAPDLSNPYRLQAKFDPETGALSVKGTMDVVADRRTESLKLLLNDGLVVRSFTADGKPAKVEPRATFGGETVPGAQAIVVPLARPLETGQRLTLRFAYDGAVTTDRIKVGRGIVSPVWTELTFESFWYPVLIEEQLIRSELILSVPERYDVVGPGVARRIAPGRWRLDPEGVVAGRITFALSDRWHVERRMLKPGLQAALYTIKPEPRAGEILDSVTGAFAAYTGLFGPPRTQKERITLLYPNAEIGVKYPNQAFATGGDFIVMSKGEVKGQLETLQHEIAHLWWSRGRPGTADEFLSESISEYLASRRGGEMFGSGWLADRRAAMAKRSAAIQASLLDLNGGGTAPRQPLLYDRGPTALWSLHDRIGEMAMNQLLQDAYKVEIGSLEHFLRLVEQRHGAETLNWFRAQL